MDTFIHRLCLVALLSIGFAGSAAALPQGPDRSGAAHGRPAERSDHDRGRGRGREHGVPEFDAAAVGVVAALAAGGGILVARRRRK